MVRMKWMKGVVAFGLAAILALAPCTEVFAASEAEAWAAYRSMMAAGGRPAPDTYVSYSKSATLHTFNFTVDGTSMGTIDEVESAQWFGSSGTTVAISSSSGGGGGLTPEQEKAIQEAIRIQEEAKAAAAANVKNSTTNTGIRSTAPGSYTASSLDGAATTQPKEMINQNLGLAPGESIHISTWDLTSRDCPAAYVSLEAAAKSVNGKMGPTIEFDANKMSGGRLSALDSSAGSIEASFGIPANFRSNDAQYAVAQVVPGGDFHVYLDKDNSPYTVTADLVAGSSAVALIQVGTGHAVNGNNSGSIGD